MRVFIHPDVETRITELTEGQLWRRTAILGDLQDLEFEPEPSRQAWRVTSMPTELLRRRGLNVRRLTLSTNLPDHRFFYLHDAEHQFVYIMEVVKRTKKTYDDAPHIRNVAAKYSEYYREHLWLKL